MIKIKIKDGQIKALLNTLSGRVRDMSPVMRVISGIMRDAVEENFAQEGRPKWPGLAAATIKQRTKEGKWPGKILQKSQGGLAASISSKYDDHSAQVGTNKKDYAAIHQFSGAAGRGRKVFIPARPYLKLADADMTKIHTVILSHITKNIT